MYSQRDIRWKNEIMGFGVGTIGNYGCYLTSLCNGLNQKGYSFTPFTLNELFKQNGLWGGPFNNYIEVEYLDDKLPNIFRNYSREDSWNDDPSLDTILSDKRIALGEVDGKPIGGTTHFVLITGKNRSTAVIHDPWSDVEEKITVRWGKLGNILGLRIFDVKPHKEPELESITESDLDYERGLEELTTYRNDRVQGPEGNWEAYVRSIIGNDKDMVNVQDALKACETDLKKFKGKSSTLVQESAINTFLQQLMNWYKKRGG